MMKLIELDYDEKTGSITLMTGKEKDGFIVCNLIKKENGLSFRKAMKRSKKE